MFRLFSVRTSLAETMKTLGILCCVLLYTLVVVSIKFTWFHNECFSETVNLTTYPANSSENSRNQPSINRKSYVTHGKWMPGKRHNHTCLFIDESKCCKNQQNTHFEFNDKKLSKINAVKKLREILRTKKLLLIGDSLMFEFFIGLKELLRVKTAMTMTKYFCPNTSCPLHVGANSTVTFLKACMIALESRNPFTEVDKSRLIPAKKIRKEIADHDIVFFNQGVHYDIRKLLIESTIYFNNIGNMLHGKD